MAFCTQCGSKLNDGAAFCGQCGAKVKDDSSYSKSTKKCARNSDLQQVDIAIKSCEFMICF